MAADPRIRDDRDTHTREDLLRIDQGEGNDGAEMRDPRDRAAYPYAPHSHLPLPGPTLAVRHAHHMSQIAPNVISRDLSPLERPRAKPGFPQASCELGHAGQPLVGWGRYVAGPRRARRAQISPKCAKSNWGIRAIATQNATVHPCTQLPTSRYWCGGMQAPMRRPEAPSDQTLS